MTKDFESIDDYIAELESRLQKNDQCASSHYNLGIAYLSKRRYDAAKTCFLRAAERSPTMAEAYVQLGGLAMNEGDIEGCLSMNQAALKARARFAVPHSNIGFCLLQMGQVDEALKALRKAIKLDSQFVQAYGTLGSALYMAGETDESIEMSKRAIELHPKFGPAWNNLALAYLEKGDAAQAMSCVKQAKECNYEVHPGLISEIEAKLKG
ncbi:MAG: tetratricopeptide repeat protein [Desulfovibrio sp.]|jgi:tetratricopeptide (TPR) repeat protein|nr:tetratricopeptide repeat protein [Desulfovibrio sp.]MBI4959701.1 tetratricopeptide repeat protein [Desulfovibrio sp.]